MAKRKRGTDDTYLGHSGQMAVMSELLRRKCNVARPDVDEGTDLFAFLEGRSEIARIQVKAATARPYKLGEGYHAQFDIPMAQLEWADNPPLYYVLAASLDERWESFLVVSRRVLRGYWDGEHAFGTENHTSGNLVLTIRYREKVLSQEVDLSRHLNAWEELPPVRAIATPPPT
jgi:hypothetical protein